MVLAVIHDDAHVDHRVACDGALSQHFTHALFDRGDVLRGDGAAFDLVDELEAGAARQRLDAQERIRKTDLMQQVNQAYEARDLLALLELQLKIEQIDPTALANLARERLAHYNWVLKEQLARLHEQLSETLAPFEMTLFGRLRGKLTPEAVSRALAEDLRELKTTLREIEADLVSFQDPNRLKASLKHYHAGPSEDELEFFEAQLFADLGARRR